MNPIRCLVRMIATFAFVATSAPSLAQTAIKQVVRTPADSAAVAGATRHFSSAMPNATMVTAGSKLRTDQQSLHAAGHDGGSSTQNPADLGYTGGATIPSATHHPLYLIPDGSACNTPSCWGNVSQFLQDLNRSDFIHITDQYVGASGGGRYPVSFSLAGHYTLPALPLLDSDMAAWAHAAATFLGVSGYGHIFHIFLTPEQNVCFDSSYTVCSSNYFCAYHGSAYFSDIGEVVYTVEPYNVSVFGCNQPAGSPNGGYDDTYSVLSHEVFETLTDPDGGSWWNFANNALFGNEIGDECLFLLFDTNGFFSATGGVVQTLAGRRYQIQTEYDNSSHACKAHSGS